VKAYLPSAFAAKKAVFFLRFAAEALPGVYYA